jgi:predicted transport protein
MSNPDPALLTMIANFPSKTGKSLDEWVKLAKVSRLAKHGEIVKMLKSDHGMSHGYANLVALQTLKGDVTAPAPAAGDAESKWFVGDKAAIRPVYDAVMAAVAKLGKDVELAPKLAYMSVRRSKQFACVHPSTKSRLDLGLQLKGIAPTGRLEKAGSWNAMVSHRVRLESAKDFDTEVKGWLKQAYDAA